MFYFIANIQNAMSNKSPNISKLTNADIIFFNDMLRTTNYE